MKTVNIHEAKTHLSRLLDELEHGEPFIIAKAGKPLAKVTAIHEKPPQRLGSLRGRSKCRTTFDTMFADEIADMFEGKYDGSGLFERKS